MIKKLFSFVIAAAMFLSALPTIAAQQDNIPAATAIESSNAVWETIELTERRLLDTKADKNAYMQAAYDLVKAQPEVSELRWDDDDTFTFNIGSVPCAYDYDIRMVELHSNQETKSTTVSADFEYTALNNVKGSAKNVFLAAPYYGYDTDFDTSFYKNIATKAAEQTGGTATVLSGGELATPQAIRDRFASAQDALMIFDSHGVSVYNSSYFCVRSSAGITTNDLSKSWAISLGGGVYGIDGRFMTNGATTPMSYALCWFCICEGMMTNGLCAPLLNAGAGCIYGYSQSVSFKKDYAFSTAFYNELLSGSTVAQSIAAMKAQCGNYDNFVSPVAYPIVVSAEDSYPANPDAVQTVKSTWTLLSDICTVRFVDWDGKLISTQTVNYGEAATAPANPSREGYTFTGWDKDFSNVTSDLTVTAQYSINTYTVTFVDFDGTVLSTQSVNHGEAATAPADPSREGYTFTGWDKDFSNITSDLTVTAQYSINTYTVTFVDFNGTVLSTQSVNYGEAATAPEAPTRPAYEFIGWDIDFSNVTENLTVTAQYKFAKIMGDLTGDGTVNTADAVVLLKYAANMYVFSDEQWIIGDVNQDTEINTADAVFILKHCAGMAVLPTEPEK